MTELSKTSFIIQCIDKVIVNDKVHELKEELDKDYKYLVGIAIRTPMQVKNPFWSK